MAQAQATVDGLTYTDYVRRHGVGIPAVECVLMSLDGTRLATTVSHGNVRNDGDAYTDGWYRFTNLQPGQYIVEFYGEDFKTPDDNKVINVAGSADEIIPSENYLATNISDARAIVWCSRMLTDSFKATTAIVRNELTLQPANQTGLNIDENSYVLRLPEGHILPNTDYVYSTLLFETDDPPTTQDIEGMDIATMKAYYVLGDQSLKIESTMDGGSSWYTWLDTAGGIYRLEAEKESGTDWVQGTKFGVRVTMTTGANTLPSSYTELHHYALFTGPDLFDEDNAL